MDLSVQGRLAFARAIALVIGVHFDSLGPRPASLSVCRSVDGSKEPSAMVLYVSVKR